MANLLMDAFYSHSLIHKDKISSIVGETLEHVVYFYFYFPQSTSWGHKNESKFTFKAAQRNSYVNMRVYWLESVI